MTGITLLLLTAALALGLARWSGLPAIPFFIVGGALASWAAPLPEDFLQDALYLGLTVMVFVAGIELNPGKMGVQRRAAVTVGLIQFLVLGGLGLAAGRLLGFDWGTSAYVALALTASSTLVVVRLLQRRQQLYEPFGRLVTGVLLLQDLLVILLIPVLIRLPYGWGAVGVGVLSTLVLVGLAAVMLRWVAPFLIQRLAFDEESLLLVVLTVLFGFLALAHLFDLPLVAGAFLAGVALSGFPVNALVRGQLTSLSDFFGAFFFTSLGAFLVVPTLPEVMQTGVLVLLVILMTPPLVAFVAEKAGLSARPALFSGLLLSQTSEFSLVVALQGVVLGQIAPGVFTVITLMTVVTMAITPFLATDSLVWRLVHIHPFRERHEVGEGTQELRNHIVLVGCGRSGLTLLETLMVGPNPILVVDDDPTLVERVQEAEVPAIRGDISDPRVAEAARAREARIIISTIRRTDDNLPLLDRAGDTPFLARAFNDEEGDRIRARGGRPVSYAEAAAEDFLAWYRDEWKEGGEADGG